MGGSVAGGRVRDTSQGPIPWCHGALPLRLEAEELRSDECCQAATPCRRSCMSVEARRRPASSPARNLSDLDWTLASQGVGVGSGSDLKGAPWWGLTGWSESVE